MVQPRRSDQAAAGADDRDATAQAELLGLVDRAPDEDSSAGEGQVPWMHVVRARVHRHGQAPTML